MKKILTLLPLVLFLLFFGCLSTESKNVQNLSVTPIQKCLEIEKGINYSGVEYKDFCVSNSVLKTYSCEGEILSSSEKLCPSGSVCIENVCVGNQNPSTENSTSVPNGSGSTTSEPSTPVASALCTDSDFGQNPTQFGTVSFNGSVFSDFCNANFDVQEYYCENDSAKSKSISCGTGNPCRSGACSSPVLTCSDTNTNSPLSVGSVNQYRGGVVSTTFNDVCVDSSKKTSFSCQGGIVKNETLNCPFGTYCSRGACIGNCVDSDGGLRYTTAGSAKSSVEEKFDFCSDQGTLVEYYCDANQIVNVTYGCGGPCGDGKCLQRQDVRCTDTDFGVDLYYATQKVYTLENTCNSKSSAKIYSCDGNYFTSESDSCTNKQTCYQGDCQSIRELGCVDYHGSPTFENSIVVPDEDNNRKVYSDYCRNSVEAVVYSCDGARLKSQSVSCNSNQTCVDGVCVVRQ